jgi:hypothetical protein
VSVVPVLASPDAVAVLDHKATQFASLLPVGPITVRVVATLNSTPAQPGGGTFVVMALRALSGLFGERDTRLVLAVAMPAVLAAALAGAARGLVLPHLIGSSIDLSAFTGTGVPVQFQPDMIALGLLAEASTMRRQGITSILWAN